MLSGNNGLLKRAGQARDDTVIGQEKEQVELAYISASIKKLGDHVDENDLQTELNSSVGNNKTKVTKNSNNTLNVLFNESKHNYNVNNGQVAKIDRLEDGFYIGNVRMCGLYLSDWMNEDYNDYSDRVNIAEQETSIFFQKCFNKEEANYTNALNIANTYGINKEIIDWAYNNKEDKVKNVMVSSYDIELADYQGSNVSIHCGLDIESEKYNFSFSLNPTLTDPVLLHRDDETNPSDLDYDDLSVNPESIGFCYLDLSKPIPSEVQLPFGMKLKHDENLITPLYEEYISWGESQEEALENAKENACVIEWQGRTFTCDELREFINNNIKIAYNGNVWNISEENTFEKLNEMFGIDLHTFMKLFNEIDLGE